MEFRWYKSVDDNDYRLQHRKFNDEKWKDIPFVLEGAEAQQTDAADGKNACGLCGQGPEVDHKGCLQIASTRR